MGASVGSRILTMWCAMFLLALFAILGAVLEGHNVIKTIGEKVVVLENFDNVQSSVGFLPTPFSIVPIAALTATLSATIWVRFFR